MFVSYIVVYTNLVVLCAVRSKRESGSIGVICHSKQMLVGILNFDILKLCGGYGITHDSNHFSITYQ